MSEHISEKATVTPKNKDDKSPPSDACKRRTVFGVETVARLLDRMNKRYEPCAILVDQKGSGVVYKAHRQQKGEKDYTGRMAREVSLFDHIEDQLVEFALPEEKNDARRAGRYIMLIMPGLKNKYGDNAVIVNEGSIWWILEKEQGTSPISYHGNILWKVHKVGIGLTRLVEHMTT